MREIEDGLSNWGAQRVRAAVGWQRERNAIVGISKGVKEMKRIGENQRRGASILASVLCAAVVAAFLVPLSVSAQTVLPGFRAPMVEDPATINAYTSKLGQGTYPPGPALDDPEITELARGLRYDPNLMCKFVHDHIRFTPTWGETKGAYMTWMDRSGNGFDQATLLIALLTEAAAHSSTYPITDIQYGVGDIQLTAEQFTKWFGVPDSERIAKEVLARGGFYGEVTADTGGYIANVKLVHVWVKVSINGQTYRFDPSFKSHIVRTGVTVPLSSAMGYDRDTFIANAQRQGGGWNTVNIRQDLDKYSTNLIDYIRRCREGKDPNLPDIDDSLEDVIGAKRIEPVDETPLVVHETTPPVPQPLPYTPLYLPAIERESFGIGAIRSLHRTTLRIQHCGIDQTFYSSDIYGRRLSIQYDGLQRPELTLDGELIATGSAGILGDPCDLTLTVNHPYEADDFDASTTLHVKIGGFYQIVNGWGDTGTKILLKHRGLLQQYMLDGDLDSDETVRGESYAIVGLTWLAKTSAMRAMAAETDDHTVVNHHILGVAGQYGAPYTDMGLMHLGVVDHGIADRPQDLFYAIAGHATAYEHEVIRNLQDCNAVSTAKLFEMANNHPTYNDIFTARTPQEWTNIQSQLVNYSDPEKARISPYITAGFEVAMPEYGDLTQDAWTGMGFRALQTSGTTYTVAHIVGDGYKGGVSCTTGDMSPSTLLDNSLGAASDGDPEGAYGTGSTDIAIGSGGIPFGLAFGRQYSSHRRTKDGPLGLGWTHNLDISAKVSSDSWRYLGAGSATEAAAHIVSLRVSRNVLVLGEHTLAALCQNWLMDKMKDNIVDIKQGSSITRFTKVDDPNRVYQAPAGQHLKLIREIDSSFLLKDASGVFYDFDSNGRFSGWSDAHGNLVDFTYENGKLDRVTTKLKPDSGDAVQARFLDFTYDENDHIISATDSANRSISYAYDPNGNLERCTNPDGNSVTYEYHSTNKGQMTKIYRPVEPGEPNVAVLTVGYDSLGRMVQLTDANNCTWDYYSATYRMEVLEPAQVDPCGIRQRFSTISWVNPEARTLITKDQLGRETVQEYDSEMRLQSVTGPSGVTAEYTYDDDNNVIRADSISVPASGDADVHTSSEYDEYEDPITGRWFMRKSQDTSVIGRDTIYEYDYDDPNCPSPKGELRKITYPDVNTPDGIQTPVRTFTYWPDGRVCQETDPNQMVTRYEYYTPQEGAGLKKTIIDYGTGGLNITTETGYDNVGRVTWIKDPKGNIAQNEYFATGRLRKIIAPAPFNYETRYEYYADGKVKYVKQVTPVNLMSDPNCVALWCMEDGALTVDSKGSNDLTNHGVVSSTTHKEGSYSGDFVASSQDYMGVPDASLCDDFPFTDTNNKATICFWTRFDVLPGNGDVDALWSKYHTTQNKRTFTIYATGNASGQYIGISIGHTNGTGYEPKYHGSDLSTGRWYHVAVTFDGSTKGYRIRIWDDTAGALLGTDAMGAFTNSISIGDADLVLGAYSNLAQFFDGRMDQMVVFNRVLTTTEIDHIRAGTYGSSSQAQVTYLQSITYNNRGQKATVRGPYPENPTQNELDINYTQYAYDSLGRPWKVTDAEGNITTTRYCPDGKVWKVVDAEGHATVTNIYDDEDGSLKETLDANGHSTSRQYNGFRGLKRTTYEDGTYTEATYDEYRRLISRINRAGEPLTVSYNEKGQFISETYSSNTIRYKYDILNRTVETTDNTGTIRTFFDRVGRVSRIEYPGSKSVRYQYDAAGNRTRLTYPDNTYITYEYDQLGRLTKVKDQAGNSLAQYSFDGLSRRSALTYANGTSIGYEYDTANRLLAIDNQTDSGQHKYAYAYDNVGNRTMMSVIDSGGTEMHAYDYDNIYQVTGVDYPVGYDPNLATDTTFDYDGVGNRTTVTDGSGIATYTTNPLNQYTAIDTVNYSYDDKGNMTQDDAHTYTYDAKNRLITVTKTAPSIGPLAGACDTNLTLTTGGNANWASQTSDYYYDGDATRSGDIDANEVTWMETTVEGTGTISFWWKVSSQTGDEVGFYIDGVWKAGRSGSIGWDDVNEPITTTGTHTLRWKYFKDASGSAGSDCAWVDYIVWTPTSTPPANILNQYVDSELTYTTDGSPQWSGSTTTYYYNGDSAQSGDIDNSEESWMQTTVEGEGTFSFYWKVSSESGYDWLEFYIDGNRQDRISGSVNWQQKSYNITGSATHTLKWLYIKDGGTSEGDDCGWVDYVQWTGQMPVPTDWQTIRYTYDPSGRRIVKAYDGTTIVKYLYDGDHCIAEYSSNDQLLRKYIYGPGVDQPICMIEATGSYAGTYYYHFDGLGSVVALTGSSGTVVQLYEYSVYGRVSVWDEHHPNRFMFTGREFDKDTDLYYYRARYYNPEIGRFLQSDPMRNGMNWYAYCSNNPIGRLDPSGCMDFPDHSLDYTFEFTCPSRAIVQSMEGITTPEQVLEIASGFFYAGWASWPWEWTPMDAHLEDNGDIHILFSYYYNTDWTYAMPDRYPAPTPPAMSWKYINESSIPEERCMEPVVLVNDIALLEPWKFDIAIAPSQSRACGWRTRPGGPHLWYTQQEYDLLNDFGDTPFHSSPIDKWEWWQMKKIYDNSQINYYFQGWAMRHFDFMYRLAQGYVLGHKNKLRARNGLPPIMPWELEGEYYWFDMGWNEHGSNHGMR